MNLSLSFKHLVFFFFFHGLFSLFWKYGSYSFSFLSDVSSPVPGQCCCQPWGFVCQLMQLSSEPFLLFLLCIFFFPLQAIFLHLLALITFFVFSFPAALLSVIFSLSLFPTLSSKNADFTSHSSSCLCLWSILKTRSNIIKLWYIHIIHRSIFLPTATVSFHYIWNDNKLFLEQFQMT